MTDVTKGIVPSFKAVMEDDFPKYKTEEMYENLERQVLEQLDKKQRDKEKKKLRKTFESTGKYCKCLQNGKVLSYRQARKLLLPALCLLARLIVVK